MAFGHLKKRCEGTPKRYRGAYAKICEKLVEVFCRPSSTPKHRLAVPRVCRTEFRTRARTVIVVIIHRYRKRYSHLKSRDDKKKGKKKKKTPDIYYRYPFIAERMLTVWFFFIREISVSRLESIR